MSETQKGEDKKSGLRQIYEEVMQNIRDIRPRAEDGDLEAHEALEMLEKKASLLAKNIAEEEGLPDPYRDDPILEKWENLWEELRKARRNGENEDPIWEEIYNTAAQIDARESFSKN
jgi:hypothetical protein